MFVLPQPTSPVMTAKPALSMIPNSSIANGQAGSKMASRAIRKTSQNVRRLINRIFITSEKSNPLRYCLGLLALGVGPLKV